MNVTFVVILALLGLSLKFRRKPFSSWHVVLVALSAVVLIATQIPTLEESNTFAGLLLVAIVAVLVSAAVRAVREYRRYRMRRGSEDQRLGQL
jgi:peptidoglycan/LPS O-acetylase OafA/YrhL